MFNQNLGLDSPIICMYSIIYLKIKVKIILYHTWALTLLRNIIHVQIEAIDGHAFYLWKAGMQLTFPEEMHFT